MALPEDFLEWPGLRPWLCPSLCAMPGWKGAKLPCWLVFCGAVDALRVLDWKCVWAVPLFLLLLPRPAACSCLQLRFQNPSCPRRKGSL